MSSSTKEAPPNPLPEDTALVNDTVPPADEKANAVAERLLDSVTTAISVDLAVTQNSCVIEALGKLDESIVQPLWEGAALLDQPVEVQTMVFDTFDGCVSPKDFGRAAAPRLTAAGVEQPVAACVFRNMDEAMGFAGLYRYFLGTTGEVDPDPALAAAVVDAYDACDLDPTTITLPGGSTTTTVVVDETAEPVPSTTTTPPVQPAENVISSSIPSFTTTTVPRATTTTRADATSTTPAPTTTIAP